MEPSRANFQDWLRNPERIGTRFVGRVPVLVGNRWTEEVYQQRRIVSNLYIHSVDEKR